MRNLASSFTMRKDGVLPKGDWFNITNNAPGETPKIYIYDEIGFWGTEASDFIKQLNDINSLKLELHLNSPGGEVFDGLAIFNALKQHKAEVTVYVDGLAASAASFIAQAGDNVIMARNAQMMIHDGIAFAYGNEQDMLDTAQLLSQISNNIADIYAYRAAKRGFDNTVDDFRALMREEVWYTGKEAVDAGLADTVLDHDQEEAATAANKWDLSFYNHAGRERAESPTRIAARLLVSNQAKENKMGNSPVTNSEQPGGNAPAEDPEGEGTPTGAPNEQGAEVIPGGDPVPPNETVTADQPETPSPEQPTAKAGQQGVLINGKLETDWTVINRHFEALNTAQNEARETFRKEFVEGLSNSNRIPATQVDSLTVLALSLSDEQFADFQASYESSTPSSLFDNHAASGGTPSQPGQPVMTDEAAKADRIAVLQGVVAMHERTMTPDKVKTTKSYIELQSLLGTNKS